MPAPALAGRNASRVQVVGDLGGSASARGNGMTNGCLDFVREHYRIVAMAGGKDGSIRTEPNASRFRGSQSRARAVTDHFALVFGKGRHDVQNEAGGVRHVHREKIGFRLHQRRDERDRPRKSVELGDEQDCLLALTRRQCVAQLWPVALAARFNLDELSDHVGGPANQKLPDGFLLGFETETGAALTIRRDPVVGDEAFPSHDVGASLEQVKEGLPVPNALRASRSP